MLDDRSRIAILNIILSRHPYRCANLAGMYWHTHHWNRRWNRHLRRDLYIYASPWRVVARVGGADGVSETYPVDDEAAARAMVEQAMQDGGDWVELTVRPRDT